MNTYQIAKLLKEDFDLLKIYNKNKEKLENPDWEKNEYGDYYPKGKQFGSWIHCWESYVPNAFKDNWSKLSKEVKVTLFIIGEKQAEDEEWD